MKLNDVYSKPLSEVIEQMEMVKLDVHADSSGEVQCIELKYVNPKANKEGKRCS